MRRYFGTMNGIPSSSLAACTSEDFVGLGLRLEGFGKNLGLRVERFFKVSVGPSPIESTLNPKP